MNKERGIVTSTGELGVCRRTDDRIYWNHGLLSDERAITEICGRFSGVIDRHEKRVSRAVLRFVTTDSALQKISSGKLGELLEAAVEIDNNGFNSSRWLVLLSKNSSKRVSPVPKEEIIENTNERGLSLRNPVERIREVVERRAYSFRNGVHGWEESLLELWGETFGWSMPEIENLSERLEYERGVSPKDKSLWVSMITSNGQVIAAVMAERLTLPFGEVEGHVDLIESTEWRTRNGFYNQGLLTAALVYLNSQIIDDLKSNIHCAPLIFAECNYATRSDRAAYGAGFVVPKRDVYGGRVPQILVQNVRINDGLLPCGLRDFTFVHLPKESKANIYSEGNIRQMNEIPNIGR